MLKPKTTAYLRNLQRLMLIERTAWKVYMGRRIGERKLSRSIFTVNMEAARGAREWLRLSRGR